MVIKLQCCIKCIILPSSVLLNILLGERNTITKSQRYYRYIVNNLLLWCKMHNACVQKFFRKSPVLFNMP